MNWRLGAFLGLWVIQFCLWGWDSREVERIRQAYPGNPKAVLTYPEGARLEFVPPRGPARSPYLENSEALTRNVSFESGTASLDGYQSQKFSSVNVNSLEVIVLPRGWPRWLLWHLPIFLSLALVAAVWKNASHQIEAQRDRKTSQVIAQKTFQPGTVVGPYRIQEKLGSGATSEVFRAVTEVGGKLVALKILHEAVSQLKESRDRFQREVKICQSLRHPRVVGVLGHGEVKERLWMAQEFVEGSSLESLAPPLPVDQVVSILIQICEGLAYAHEAGVVHRDLKPANILLRVDGTPVIADFGLARGENYATITKTDTTLGTPAYMPPEQVQGLPTNEASDLYSLGCIAFEMLTGHTPFVKQDAIQMITAHLLQPAPLVSDLRPEVPPALAQVVARLLEKAPGERYASAAELRRALSEIS